MNLKFKTSFLKIKNSFLFSKDKTAAFGNKKNDAANALSIVASSLRKAYNYKTELLSIWNSLNSITSPDFNDLKKIGDATDKLNEIKYMSQLIYNERSAVLQDKNNASTQASFESQMNAILNDAQMIFNNIQAYVSYHNNDFANNFQENYQSSVPDLKEPKPPSRSGFQILGSKMLSPFKKLGGTVKHYGTGVSGLFNGDSRDKYLEEKEARLLEKEEKRKQREEKRNQRKDEREQRRKDKELGLKQGMFSKNKKSFLRDENYHKFISPRINILFFLSLITHSIEFFSGFNRTGMFGLWIAIYGGMALFSWALLKNPDEPFDYQYILRCVFLALLAFILPFVATSITNFLPVTKKFIDTLLVLTPVYAFNFSFFENYGNRTVSALGMGYIFLLGVILIISFANSAQGQQFYETNIDSIQSGKEFVLESYYAVVDFGQGINDGITEWFDNSISKATGEYEEPVTVEEVTTKNYGVTFNNIIPLTTYFYEEREILWMMSVKAILPEELRSVNLTPYCNVKASYSKNTFSNNCEDFLSGVIDEETFTECKVVDKVNKCKIYTKEHKLLYECIKPTCGNAILEDGEECDLGDGKNGLKGETCTKECKLVVEEKPEHEEQDDVTDDANSDSETNNNDSENNSENNDANVEETNDANDDIDDSETETNEETSENSEENPSEDDPFEDEDEKQKEETKEITYRKGKIDPMISKLYDGEVQEFDCSFDMIPEGKSEIFGVSLTSNMYDFTFGLVYNYKTEANYELFFIEESQNRFYLSQEKSPMLAFGKNTNQPISVFSPGPISLGIKSDKNQPLVIYNNKKRNFFPLVFNIAYNWEGKIRNVTDVVLYLPKFFVKDDTFCDAKITEVSSLNTPDFNAFRLDSNDLNEKFFSKPSSNYLFMCSFLLKDDFTPQDTIKSRVKMDVSYIFEYEEVKKLEVIKKNAPDNDK